MRIIYKTLVKSLFRIVFSSHNLFTCVCNKKMVVSVHSVYMVPYITFTLFLAFKSVLLEICLIHDD